MYIPHLEQTKPFTFTHAIAEKSKFARNLKNSSILVCSRLLGRHSPTFVPEWLRLEFLRQTVARRDQMVCHIARLLISVKVDF